MTGNVFRGYDGDAVPIESGVEVNLLDDTARDGRAQRDGMKAARKRIIVDIFRDAGELLWTFFAEEAL